MKNTSKNTLCILGLFFTFPLLIECKENNSRIFRNEHPVGILDFLQQNGKKFLTFASLDMDQIEVKEMLKNLYRQSKLWLHFRSKKMDFQDFKSIHRYDKKPTHRFVQDSLVMITHSESTNWKEYLSVISETKVMSSVVICIGTLKETEQDKLRSLVKTMPKTCSFIGLRRKDTN